MGRGQRASEAAVPLTDVSVSSCCVTNLPSGWKWQTLPYRGSEGLLGSAGDFSLRSLRVSQSDVSWGSSHSKTGQGWTSRVVHSWDRWWPLAGSSAGAINQTACPCTWLRTAQQRGPRGSILKANTSGGSGSSWKGPYDPASEVTQSHCHHI